VAILAYGITACATVTPIDKDDYDLILRGGTIVDGTGAGRYVADVGIRSGRIAMIGDLGRADSAETRDASGMVIAPGFIDVHSHADKALRDPRTASIAGFLHQGVTTAVFGIDGEASLEDFKTNIAASEAGLSGINFMSYIGHGGVRAHVMGNASRAPDATELAAMKAEVDTAMKLGAVGLSSGLMYLPGRYATSDEVVELAKIVAPYGGSYDTHTRDPINDWVGTDREALDIANAAGVRAHLAHEKAVGAKNFGKSHIILAMINARIAAGQPITADVYPYDGASTRTVMSILYPASDTSADQLYLAYVAALDDRADNEAAFHDAARALASYWAGMQPGSSAYAAAKERTEAPPEGTFSWVETVGYQSMRVVASKRKEFEGRMVTEIAASLQLTPFELFRHLVIEDGPDAMVTLGAIQEEEVRTIMVQPWAMIASDGEEVTVEHPRARGTFPRVLGRYVREWGVLTLEEGVHKMTGMPADYLRLPDRGTIRVGAVADITIFDPDTVIDRADWAHPLLYATGIRDVLIGGKFAVRDGAVTRDRLGRFIPFSKRH